MKATIKKNGKLTASLILFIIAMICLLVFILYYAIPPLKEFVPFFILPTASCGFITLPGISLAINLSYRKNALRAGVLSTVLLVLCGIIVIPIAIILFLILIFTGNLGALMGSASSSKKITIIDEDGREYTLTQIYDGSNDFFDQYGDLWRTEDGGQTFRRVNPKEVQTEDDKGNKQTLTSTYDSMFTKHYQDQNGEEWKSEDGGQTFEHVVTHATVTDPDGNVYELRATQAGIYNFIDQNGDSWTTFDGGETFQRVK